MNSHNLQGSEVEIRTIQQNFKDVDEIQEQNTKTKKEISKIQMRSEAVNKSYQRHPQLSNVQYKKNLIKLMVKVKFERFGFKQSELDQQVSDHIGKIQNLADVQPQHLNEVATEVFLDIFSTIIGERNFLTRLLGARDMNMEEQR